MKNRAILKIAAFTLAFSGAALATTYSTHCLDDESWGKSNAYSDKRTCLRVAKSHNDQFHDGKRRAFCL